MYDLKPYLTTIDQVIEKGPYKDDWHSLAAYQVPEWYRQAKFGIFIHWGVFSVPAFANEWYSRNMYVKDSAEYQHHIETYGEHTKFGYQDFIPMFRAENFDPGEWRSFLRQQEQNMSFLLQSIMMAFRCIKAGSLTGMPMKKGRIGMCCWSLRQAAMPLEWKWAHPPTVPSTGFLWE